MLFMHLFVCRWKNSEVSQGYFSDFFLRIHKCTLINFFQKAFAWRLLGVLGDQQGGEGGERRQQKPPCWQGGWRDILQRQLFLGFDSRNEFKWIFRFVKKVKKLLLFQIWGFGLNIICFFVSDRFEKTKNAEQPWARRGRRRNGNKRRGKEILVIFARRSSH